MAKRPRSPTDSNTTAGSKRPAPVIRRIATSQPSLMSQSFVPVVRHRIGTHRKRDGKLRHWHSRGKVIKPDEAAEQGETVEQVESSCDGFVEHDSRSDPSPISIPIMSRHKKGGVIGRLTSERKNTTAVSTFSSILLFIGDSHQVDSQNCGNTLNFVT